MKDLVCISFYNEEAYENSLIELGKIDLDNLLYEDKLYGIYYFFVYISTIDQKKEIASKIKNVYDQCLKEMKTEHL